MRTPYLLFLADVIDLADAKTAAGIRQWRGELCAGQLRMPGGTLDLGLPDLTVTEAAARGIGTMIIGIANDGGFVAPHWVPSIIAALEAGLDVAWGCIKRWRACLRSPQPRDAAIVSSSKCVSRRTTSLSGPATSAAAGVCSPSAPIASSARNTLRWQSRRRCVRAESMRTSARPGKPEYSSVVAASRSTRWWATSSSGAAEWLSPASSPDHWDIIEGQGSLFHPAYAGVTLGLVHGSQPDALVLCHDAKRTSILGYEKFPIPGLSDLHRCVCRCRAPHQPGSTPCRHQPEHIAPV